MTTPRVCGSSWAASHAQPRTRPSHCRRTLSGHQTLAGQASSNGRGSASMNGRPAPHPGIRRTTSMNGRPVLRRTISGGNRIFAAEMLPQHQQGGRGGDAVAHLVVGGAALPPTKE